MHTTAVSTGRRSDVSGGRAPPARGSGAGLRARCRRRRARAIFDFEGELELEPLLPALPPVRIGGVGVATLNGSGAGAALATLSLAGGVAGTATVPVTDPMVSNGGFEKLRLKARIGSGRLRPFQPPVSFSLPQLSSGELPVDGAVKLCASSRAAPGARLPLHGVTANGPRRRRHRRRAADRAARHHPPQPVRRALDPGHRLAGAADLVGRVHRLRQRLRARSALLHRLDGAARRRALARHAARRRIPDGASRRPPASRASRCASSRSRGALFALAPSIALSVLGARRRRRRKGHS